MEFFAQKGIGLIRSPCFVQPPNFSQSFIDYAKTLIQLAYSLEEHEEIILILHGLASLFLPALASLYPQIRRFVLINPAWESVPELDFPNMSAEKIPPNVSLYIIGSQYDEVMKKEHFDFWVQNSPNSENHFCNKVNHFLMKTDSYLSMDDYLAKPYFVDFSILKNIIQWIKTNLPTT